MKYLLLAICVSLQSIVMADALAWSERQIDRLPVESIHHCIWLTASSDEEQQQQDQDEADEDDEPDCD